MRVNQLARHDVVRELFAIVSKLGDGWIWLAFGVMLYVRHGNEVLPNLVDMMVVTAMGVLIYKVLKSRLVRNRPYVSYDNIECAVAPLDQYSFPSGHTLHAVSFTIMIAGVDPVLAAIALPFAVLVALSRVLLGLHYPSDVLVGALIGAGLALGAT